MKNRIDYAISKDAIRKGTQANSRRVPQVRLRMLRRMGYVSVVHYNTHYDQR